MSWTAENGIMQGTSLTNHAISQARGNRRMVGVKRSMGVQTNSGLWVNFVSILSTIKLHRSAFFNLGLEK